MLCGMDGGSMESHKQEKSHTESGSDLSHEKPILISQAGSSWRGSSPDSPTLRPLYSAPTSVTPLHLCLGGSLSLLSIKTLLSSQPPAQTPCGSQPLAGVDTGAWPLCRMDLDSNLTPLETS